MPIFEYKCEKCGENFEQLVLGKEVPNCPKCNTNEVKKQISLCGFFNKGEDGTIKSATPSACSGCSLTNCSTCTSA